MSSIPAKYRSEAIDQGELGPAMRALNPGQRAFVDYLITNGTDNYSEAALAAGYADGPGIRVTACRMHQHPKVIAALVEEGGRRYNSYVPMAIKTIVTIAKDITHKDALKAATGILAAAGISAVSKSETHVVHHNGSLMDDVRAAATVLGVDPDELMRGRMVKDVTPRRNEPITVENRPISDLSDEEILSSL